MNEEIKQRLEYLRGELRAEGISYEELVELQSLAEHIQPGDVELLEVAGVPETPADVRVENHGSIILVHPLTDTAEQWIDQHVSDDSQWFGHALVVEPRYVGNLVQGMVNDGLVVE